MNELDFIDLWTGKLTLDFGRSTDLFRSIDRSKVSLNAKGAAMNKVDGDKLNGLVGKMLGDLGGAFSVTTVRIGYRRGLFDALQKDGPATAAELAKRTGLAARYVREWA